MEETTYRLPLYVPLGSIGGTLAILTGIESYKTHDPFVGGLLAILTYTTTEAINISAGEKPLCLKAASGIKKGFNKIRKRL